LNRLDLEVAPGERVAVVGPSGMGKSTLVSLLLRLHDPDEGRVLIDGVDIREFRLDSLRAQISIVLPDSLLFASSVRDNIGYGAPDASVEEIERAARLANAHTFITALPNGYDTVLGERGVTLSSGQRQRIAIARAALRRSPILILDEPTTGLDRDNERVVIEALENLSQGRTVLMITHDLELAARADRIVYLEAGQILEQGTHAELLGRGGRYAALFRTRAEQVQFSTRYGDFFMLSNPDRRVVNQDGNYRAGIAAGRESRLLSVLNRRMAPASARDAHHHVSELQTERPMPGRLPRPNF
jgi:ATP-binding cassette, subfamily B, bacterial